MIDSTNINYALSKVKEAWEGVAPQIANVTEEYVRYVVMKACIEPFAFLLVIIFLGTLSFLFHKKKGDWDDGSVIGFTISLICATVGFCCFCASLYSMILALNCPEMYTIHQIISSAK